MAGKKKIPMQIYLREDQIETLRVISKRRGESMAALIREGVDMLMDELPPEEDPLVDIIGLYDSGTDDLAEKHDEYLTRAIKEEGSRES